MGERVHRSRLWYACVVLAALLGIAVVAVVVAIVALAVWFYISLPKGYPLTDPSVPVQVRAGDEFRLVLETEPDTGYTWQLDQPIDPKLLQLVSTEDKSVGIRGGQAVWTFRALAAGQTTVAFKNVSPLPSRSTIGLPKRYTILIH